MGVRWACGVCSKNESGDVLTPAPLSSAIVKGARGEAFSLAPVGCILRRLMKLKARDNVLHRLPESVGFKIGAFLILAN